MINYNLVFLIRKLVSVVAGYIRTSFEHNRSIDPIIREFFLELNEQVQIY